MTASNVVRRASLVCAMTVGLVLSGLAGAATAQGEGVTGAASRIDDAQIASVRQLSDITTIAAGGSHTCALTQGGGVKCWGDNGYGQVGDGTTTDRLVPVDVVGLTSGVQAIAVGDYHSCALTGSGKVMCWGGNGLGSLGDGTNEDRLTPVQVVGIDGGVRSIAAGSYFNCVVTSSGGVKCWGDNSYGQLGTGTGGFDAGGDDYMRLTPADVVGLASEVSAVTSGFSHACAVTTGGGVKCWGANGSGQLGDGTEGDENNVRLTPVDVVGLSSGVTSVVASLRNSCALTTDGAKCWGSNRYGQVGDGTAVNRLTPVDVVGLEEGATTLDANWRHVCVLTGDGTAKCWGENDYGQLGDGTTGDENQLRLTPVDVVGLTSEVTAMTTGHGHTCALTASGGVKCWGVNATGQVGDGTTEDRLTPVDVVGLKAAGWVRLYTPIVID